MVLASSNALLNAARSAYNKWMQFLICTQAVDLDDPVLGFFHGWIEEISKHCESVIVICLKEGRHNLPNNVAVYSLGKESGPSRLKYIRLFYKYIWSLRNEYDSVFVHMNQEYVLLGGKFWWLWGKRIVLWRNHKSGSIFTRIAVFLSHAVCYTSLSAYVASFRNAMRMPIGIDTEVFKPGGTADPHSILFLGRFDSVKNPEILLQALDILAKKGTEFKADIVGGPTVGRELYASELKKQFSSMPNVAFKPAIRNDETIAAYNSHAIYVNLTPSGSFDKTIGEAMACGCVVVTANNAVQDVLPKELFVTELSAGSVATALCYALDLRDAERAKISARLRSYIEKEHSLSLLGTRLEDLLHTS